METFLATKLFVPRAPALSVPRGRLYEMLDAADDTPLVLVSAPAGFGKTTLLAGWIRDRGHPAAWVSLDDGDDEPRRFWGYLTAALRSVSADLSAPGAALLESTQLPSSEAIATAIVNGIASSSERVVFVLDDYHVISADSIHRGLLVLVEHMPDNARLIVTTRADPPWPLARVRAGDHMVEIRAADLRMRDDESPRLLRAAGLSLSSDEVGLLESRTEGWVAGLRMAALSMRDRADRTGFIRDFAGSHRFVLDYLAQEVLEQLGEETRDFLVRTSILDMLTGDLCDALTGLASGQATLEQLERANLFTEPLDDERRWYRYHQLFADVLRSMLSTLDPALVRDLHHRASEWFEAHGLIEQAIHHALEAQDAELSAELITRVSSATFMVDHQTRVLGWLSRLPRNVGSATPALGLIDTWTRFVTGDWDELVPSLERAAEAIGAAALSEREALQAQLDGIRAWVAYQTGDLEGCVALARSALDRMPPDGLVPHRTVATAYGYGLLLLGHTGQATDVAVDTIIQSRRARDPLTESLMLALEGQAHLLRGELGSAGTAYRRAIDAGTVGGEPLPCVAIAQVQLGEVLRERNEIADAEGLLRSAIDACEHTEGLPEWLFEGNITLARVLAARGERDESLLALSRAQEILDHLLVPGGMQPIIRRALGYRVRLWLASGDADRAEAWLRGDGLSPDGELDEGRCSLYVMLARALLANGDEAGAAQLLERIRVLVDRNEDAGTRIEFLVACALAHDALGREDDAVRCAAAAVRAAEPDGYVRAVVDAGASMTRFLPMAADADPAAAAYAERLVRVVGAQSPTATGERETGRVNGLIADPLNERELQLLRLFAAGRSNVEIAGQLYLSVNTVKWHARNAYAKLGVNRRALAVARARDLDLL